MHHVVVTYRVREESRAFLKGQFGKDVTLTFLSDMPTGLREQAIIGAEVLLSWNLPRELGPSELGLLKNTKMIQLLSAGADHVPYAGLGPHIAIAANVGAYAEPMAEHVLALVLALAKNLVKEHQNLGRGAFNQSALNRMLRGSLCGILGFGGIGRATARLLRGVGMRIAAINTSGKTGEDVEFIGTLKDLDRLLSLSDAVIIALPLTKATRGLIGKRELDRMKPDAILVNVARGAIVDEAALYEHLVGHPSFRAAIDAWWVEPFKDNEFRTTFPFLSLPSVIGSPHNSAMVPGMNGDATRRAAENVKRYLKGEPLVGVVDREEYL